MSHSGMSNYAMFSQGVQGRGNSKMVSASVCQLAGQVRSRYDSFVSERWNSQYQHVINLSPAVPTTGSPKTIHVLSSVCDSGLADCKHRVS